MASDCIRNGAFSGRHDPLLRCSVAGALRTMGAVLLETMAASFPKADCGSFGSGDFHPPNVEADAFLLAPVLGCIFGDALDALLKRFTLGFLRFISRWAVLACARHGLDRRGGADQQREHWFEPTAGW